MKNNFSLLFYLKKPKNYQNGPMPIYMRFTVDGRRTELATAREWEPERWNGRGERANGTKQDTKLLNAYLDDLQSKAFEAHRQLTMLDEPYTVEELRDRFLGKETMINSLMDLFRDHNAKMEALVGKEYSQGTLTCFRTSFKHTQNFLKWKYKLQDIDVKRINHAFIMDYDFYLRSKCKCKNNSTVKNMKNFGKIIRICIANGWLIADPFLNYKQKRKTVERVYLTTDELQTWANKKFSTGRLSQVRDIFLFCCFTGLAYSDVQKLKKRHIVKGVDGEQWIDTKRQKTNTPSRIPLLPTALHLLERYADHPCCEIEGHLLPVLSNQKMNAYLKEIADICGINKPITFHIARHTFATTVTLLNGVPIESVSKMLGHTNLRITQHYAKILDIKVGADMAQLRQRLATQPVES